jgi:phage shock protein E
MFSLIKKLLGFNSKPPVDFRQLMDQGAIIVDVRTPAEYKSGHIEGSVNIPLDAIPAKAQSLKSGNKTIITCCRSGARSGAAASILRKMGLTAYNGGPWDALNRKI